MNATKIIIDGQSVDIGGPGKSAYQIYVENGGTLTEPQWLASLAQGAPTFAQSVEDMTDTSKIYVMPDGHLWAWGRNMGRNYTNPVPTAKTPNVTNYDDAKIAYTALSTMSKGENLIISTTPIEESYVDAFVDTGLTYAPEDNEARIAALENRVFANAAAIASLSGTDGVAAYVAEEADRVSRVVYTRQNTNTVSFLVIADAHYLTGHADIEASVTHAGQGMNLVRRGVHIDFGVDLGDNGWGSGIAGSANRATIAMGVEELRATNKWIDESLRGIPNFRVPGNHDSLIYNYTFNGNDYLDSNDLFPMIGAYNTGAVFQDGEQDRGYCYRDFEEHKLRVIALNTSDLKDLTPSDNANPIYISGTQGKWFAETIDLSDKPDADRWSILILSHAPLDWGSGCIYLCDILKAYLDGASVGITRDGVTISHNYAGKNSATIIGNIHGHIHDFLVDDLRRLVSGATTEAIGVKRIAIPNACFERTNERGENGFESGSDGIYGIEYGEAVSYEKTANTAKDTSFCVVTIDLAAHKIYADHYGAGIDREVSY